MLTFLFFISIIHGWSSILHGLARRAVSFSRLHSFISAKHKATTGGGRPQDSPASHKVLKVVTPLDAELGLVLQLRDGLSHNVGEQVDQPGPGVAATILRLAERKAVLGHFEQCNAQRPHVRRDCVRKTLDSLGLQPTHESAHQKSEGGEREHCTHRHVVRRPDKGVGIALGADQLARDAKVAQFHLAAAGQEDV